MPLHVDQTIGPRSGYCKQKMSSRRFSFSATGLFNLKFKAGNAGRKKIIRNPFRVACIFRDKVLSWMPRVAILRSTITGRRAYTNITRRLPVFSIIVFELTMYNQELCKFFSDLIPSVLHL